MLLFLTSQKLDKQTRKEWEQSINTNNQIPSMASMLNFLEMSVRTLESVEEADNSTRTEKPQYVSKIPQQRLNKRAFRVNNTAVDNNYCLCCQNPLYKCFKFYSLSLTDKRTVIQQNNICSSAARCQQCKQNHHTIFHSYFSREKQNKHQITFCLLL